jgi:hypothetical protein
VEVAERNCPTEVQVVQQLQLLDKPEDGRLEEVVHWFVVAFHWSVRCVAIAGVP